VLCVGIDWADDHHDVCLTNEHCPEVSGTLDRFRIDQSAAGFDELHARLRQHEPDPQQILVAIETKHGLLVHDLLRQGYVVYGLNPKAVNRYKDRHTQSSAKDDARDALAMAHLLRTDRHLLQPLKLLPDDYRLLDEFCRDLRQMVDDRTRLLNRLEACLKEYYPQAVSIFSRLDALIATAFLSAYPDPEALQKASSVEFKAFLKQHHYPCPGRADALYDKTRIPAPKADPVITRAAKLRMLALVDQIATLRAHIADYERQIEELFETLGDHQNITTLPGVGERLAPELAATLGPRPKEGPPRFGCARDLEKLGGCAPVTKQSGRYKNVFFRRACNKRLRRTMRDWTQASLLRSRWAKAYYDYHKAQGHRHNTILRNLGAKLLAILFKLWHTGEDYDEQTHIDNLKANNVVWAMAL
jgi:transposase